MSAKEKPRLHLVAGNGDPELFSSDLDWFFACFDAECGLRSSQGADIGARQTNLAGYQKNKVGGDGDKNDDEAERIEVKAKKPIFARQENLPYTDRHASFRSNDKIDANHCVFTKGRRIWQRLSRIPWSMQEDLRLLYEPRRERPHIPEHRVRAAHRAYREVIL